MIRKEQIAKVIRIIMIPPVLVTVMILILIKDDPEIFGKITDYIMAIIGLGFLPVLAYPIQSLIPKLKEKGREEQRKLAFICSLVGYFLAFIYGECSHASSELRFIFRTYMIAVVMLTIVNSSLKKRASGHACSIVAPLLFLSYYIGWKMCVICIIMALISFWASLTSRRHKVSDLMAGSIVCILSFAISFMITIM